MMTNKRELILLFSGGIDSTYTAILMQDKYDKIYLITYDMLALLNTKNSQSSALELKRRFGEEKFVHRIINIDKLFRKICYESYFRDILKYRFFLLLTCGLCKLAMHWRTIIYCLDNNVREVCDGSGQGMREDPSQNEVILEEMGLLYKEFGINYFNPVFYESRERKEGTLFDLGLTPIQRPKGTNFGWKGQPSCKQVYLFLKFFDYMWTNWQGKRTSQRESRYLKSMFAYHRKKREFIKHELYKYLKQNGTQEICIR